MSPSSQGRPRTARTRPSWSAQLFRGAAGWADHLASRTRVSQCWGLLAWKHPLVFVKQAPSVDVVDRGSYLGECEAVPIPLPINLARRSDVFLHGAVVRGGIQ